MDIDARVTSSLHPSVIELIKGYDSETAPDLASTIEGLSQAYVSMIAIHNAREAAAANSLWTDDQKALHTADFADKRLAPARDMLFKAETRLEASIDQLERELSEPVTTKAAAPIAAEIRAYALNLNKAKGTTFLNNAITAGDETTVTAILGAPAYLSGLDAEMHGSWLRRWHERSNPTKAKRLKAMQGAHALLTRTRPIFHKEYYRAIGANEEGIGRLRGIKSKTEKAFTA